MLSFKMKCPTCEKGLLKKGKIKEVMHGVELGVFPALVCSGCNESFTDEATTKKIQSAAKKKGVWGVGDENQGFEKGRHSPISS